MYQYVWVVCAMTRGGNIHELVGIFSKEELATSCANLYMDEDKRYKYVVHKHVITTWPIKEI
jgi:hypothetical protein